MLKKRPLRKDCFRLFTLLVGAISLMHFSACNENLQYSKVAGETMGTYYAITFSHTLGVDISDVKSDIDSILIDINDEVSTYIETSTISEFNNAEGKFEVPSDKVHFVSNLMSSFDIYEETEGYFDPTVMPLVNYWGFGYTPKRAVTAIDSVYIDSIMTFVGLDKLNFRNRGGQVSIEEYGGQLDFSAIAKGYGVDYISEYLDQLGSENHMVEIGGEVVAKGLNDRGLSWVLGINTPDASSAYEDFIEYLSISDVALASSGNYRNYHEVAGGKYGHTIHPKTGYPEINELLAVSIIASSCNIADAYATACMVMGYAKAEEMINRLEGIEACFFIGGEDGSIKKRYSNGFVQYVAK